jgi:hypothetical protein
MFVVDEDFYLITLFKFRLEIFIYRYTSNFQALQILADDSSVKQMRHETKNF